MAKKRITTNELLKGSKVEKLAAATRLAKSVLAKGNQKSKTKENQASRAVKNLLAKGKADETAFKLAGDAWNDIKEGKKSDKVEKFWAYMVDNFANSGRTPMELPDKLF